VEALVKKLFLKVKDIVDTDLKPMVTENDNIKDVIIEISNKMLGITPVLSKNSIVGVITDGDLRRTLLNNQEISNLVAGDIMSIKPQIIDFEIKAADALKIMKNNKISQLIVTKENKYYGVLHIQNIIKEGIS
jgi:arabinose-5-phosphate isomerase